jgi:hypothetical protein
MAKPNKQNIINDIVSMIEKGMETKDILRNIAESCGKSIRSIEGYIKEAKDVVNKRNEAKEAVRLSTITEEYKEALNEAIISDIEIESILCTIARGNLEVEQIIAGNAVLRGVSPMEQIAAIDKLYKKRGSYAPIKQAATDSEGKDIEPTINVVQINTIPISTDE